MLEGKEMEGRKEGFGFRESDDRDSLSQRISILKMFVNVCAWDRCGRTTLAIFFFSSSSFFSSFLFLLWKITIDLCVNDVRLIRKE